MLIIPRRSEMNRERLRFKRSDTRNYVFPAPYRRKIKYTKPLFDKN